MSYSSEVAADSPLAYYRLGDASGTTMTDSSGNGRNGTYGANTVLGEPSLLTSDAANTAAKATITGSSIRLGTVAHASWMDVGAYAVEFWVKPAAVTNGDMLVTRDLDGTDGPWRVAIGSSGRVSLTMWTTTTGSTIINSGSGALVAGQKTHVVVEYANDGGGVNVFINGVLAGSNGSKTGAPTTTTVAMHLGGWGHSSGTFNGTLDEVAFYDHRLGATRVLAHYDAGNTSTVPTSTIAATLLSKTAAFTSATVLASSLAATMPAKVATFTSETVASSTLSATMQPKSAAFSSDVAEAVATSILDATLGGKTAAFTSSTIVDSTLSATLLARTATFTSTVVAIDPNARTSTIAAIVQPRIATVVSRAVIPVTPAPASVTEAISVVVAAAHGPVTMVGTQPVFTPSEASTPRARQQIVVNGVDVTYFRGVPTPDVTYTLLEPLLYGPGQLDLPQIAACFENEGEGDLWWLRAQAPVEVNLVVDDVVVKEGVYKGFVAAFDKSGRALSVELGGEANGRAAMRDRQVPIFPRINDIGHQIADAVRDLGLPHYPALGAVTGIETMTTGGTGHLDHINDLVAKSWTRSGKQWSVMPDESTGVYETHRKDATTIHATAFLDDEQTKATLRRDIAEEPNQIFVTCVTPAGMRVRFGKYPGLVQGPVPDFPGSMEEGDTGEGVRLLIGKLHASGYLKLSEVEGGFDEDVTEAVKALQDDAGLPQTGVVNLATWEALYDLNVTGLSLEWANIQPAAQRSKTRKFDRSANGTIMGFNDEYDPDVIVRHRTIDLGSGVTRSQAREFARTVLHDSDDPNWVGDIKFNTGALLSGEHAIGGTVTEADVMDARLLRPGMNIWLPAFDGGTLLHVSACQVDGDGIVTATVDTRFRDAMEVWEVIARNKESRNDPSRHRARRFRASTIAKDSIGEWDEFGGYLGVDITLQRGWTVFPVVAAMEGQIRRLRIVLKDPGEFVVNVYGEKVDAGWLEDINPNPLTVTGTQVWEKKADEFNDHWLLYSAGTHQEPCGYWPGRKMWESETGEEANPDYDPDADENTTGTDDDETITVTTTESSGTLTGKFVDEAGFPYIAADRKVIWVALWVRAENTIETGRIMWPQLEAGA